jgi:hypothetical protein
MQVVNNSDAFQADTGTGAVIFDYGNKTPLDILLKADDDFDRFNIRKQAVRAQNKKTTDDLLKDLKLNDNGIMLQHTPYFKEKGREIYETAAGVMKKYNGDLSTPEAQREWMLSVQLPSQQFETEVKGSVNLGGTLEKVRGELNSKPDDWSQDDSHAKIAELRLTPPDKLFANAESINPDNLLVPRKKSYQSLIVGKLKDEKIVPENVKDEKGNYVSTYTTPEGKVNSVQQTETISLNKAANLMMAYDTDADVMDAANADWSKVQGTNAEKYYTDLAATYQEQGLPVKDAFDAFRLQGIYLHNQKDKQLSSLGDNMYAKQALGDKEEMESARGLYDNITRMFAGDPQFIEPSYYDSERTGLDADGKPATGEARKEKNKMFATGVKGLEGRQLGNFITQNKAGDAKPTPNIITKAFRDPQGRVAVVTVESQMLYENGAIPQPYIVYKTPYSLLTALISGAPSEGKDVTKTDKLLGNLNKIEAEARNKYGNNWAAQAGLTPEQITQRDEIVKTRWSATPTIVKQETTTAPPADTTPKAESKPKRTYSKSKSGKKIFSDDGGKTWNYE